MRRLRRHERRRPRPLDPAEVGVDHDPAGQEAALPEQPRDDDLHRQAVLAAGAARLDDVVAGEVGDLHGVAIIATRYHRGKRQRYRSVVAPIARA